LTIGIVCAVLALIAVVVGASVPPGEDEKKTEEREAQAEVLCQRRQRRWKIQTPNS
jgi:hypothetical protein